MLYCFSNSCVEVSEALGWRCAPMDVAGLQWGCQEIFILSRWWKHVWAASFDIANLSYFIVLISDGVGRHQRVGSSCGFEIAVSHIHVWKRIVLFVSPVRMSDSCVCSFYIIYFQNISSCNFLLLLLGRPGAFDVIDILLVPDELERLWVDVSYTL